MGGDVEGAVFDHLGGGAEDAEVAAPEGGPGLVPFLQAEDEELDGPEDGPGAVGEVAARKCQRKQVLRVSVSADLQHAICLLPSQVVLDVHSRLSLHGKAEQTNEQEARSHRIPLLRRRLSYRLRISLS